MLRLVPRVVPRWITALVIGAGVVASACSSDDDTSSSTVFEMTDMAGAEDMAMNMGDPSATRADAVTDADLVSGQFVLLDTRPQGYDATAGTAWIARHDGGTTVTIELDGLLPDTDYIAHVHDDSCAENGGDHYQFEIGGSELPPNEIHLAFTADGDGNGFMTAENEQVAGPEAVAVVVHPVELIDNKIACADVLSTGS